MLKRSYAVIVLMVVMILISLNPFSLEADDSDETVLKVVGSGMGIDQDEALKNALSDAVQQAVGMMVDRESMIENENVIKDQILTYSDGYVEWYEKTDQQVSTDGIYTILIFAHVMRRDLHEKLKACNVSILDLDGESLFAEIITKKKAIEDATKMLAHILEDVPMSLLEAKLTHEKPKVIEKYLDLYKLSWTIEIKFNTDNYFHEFLPELQMFLSEIADSEATSSFCYPSKPVLDGAPGESIHLWLPNLKKMKKELPKFVWKVENPMSRSSEGAIKQNEDLLVTVNIGGDQNGSSRDWWWYILDQSKYLPVFKEVQNREYVLRIEFLNNANKIVHMDAINVEGIIYQDNGIDNDNSDYKERMHDLFSYPMFERHFPGFITPYTYGIDHDGLSVPWSVSLSPYFKTCNSYYNNSYSTEKFKYIYTVEMPLSKMRDITQIECKFMEIK